MGSKSEALAKQFEAKADEALATLQRLNETEWKLVTEAEKWPVGVTAHHFAGVLGPIAAMIETVAAGRSPDFDLSRLDEMNAQHARDFADCTRAETVALHRAGVTRAAAAIRGLSDAQLATGAPLMAGMPPMTAEELINLGLLAHADEHYDSIRRTVGHN